VPRFQNLSKAFNVQQGMGTDWVYEPSQGSDEKVMLGYT
jgi:hypothetical protein